MFGAWPRGRHLVKIHRMKHSDRVSERARTCFQLRILASTFQPKCRTITMHSSTGSGESLVYLFVAAFSQKSVLIISPLRSLCFDQVQNAMQGYGLTAAFLGPNHGRATFNSVEAFTSTSDVTLNEAILHAVSRGAQKVLYTSPEYF